MIVLRTPKGWTGPKVVDGLPVEGTFRSHQVPLTDVRDDPARLAQLEEWMRSYRPEELFDEDGALVPELQALAPKAHRRMSANAHTNGGVLLHDLRSPTTATTRSTCRCPGASRSEATRVLGRVPPRRHPAEPGELPPVRPGRDGVEPAGRGLRGDGPRLGRRHRPRATRTSRPRDA